MSTYDYKKPTPEALIEIEMVREAFRALHTKLMLDALPDGNRDARCVALCKTKLEEACMYAVKALVEARHE